MKLLAVALLLGALLALAHSDCYVMPQTSDMTHCQDAVDHIWYPIGAKWRNSQCYDCTCNGCCSAYSTPKSFPSECEAVFDQAACKYNVHLKGDPSTSCPVFGSVGK